MRIDRVAFSSQLFKGKMKIISFVFQEIEYYWNFSSLLSVEMKFRQIKSLSLCTNRARYV